MTPFRAACYRAGVGEFEVAAVHLASGRVDLVRVAREQPLQLELAAQRARYTPAAGGFSTDPGQSQICSHAGQKHRNSV